MHLLQVEEGGGGRRRKRERIGVGGREREEEEGGGRRRKRERIGVGGREREEEEEEGDRVRERRGGEKEEGERERRGGEKKGKVDGKKKGLGYWLANKILISMGETRGWREWENLNGCACVYLASASL